MAIETRCRVPGAPRRAGDLEAFHARVPAFGGLQRAAAELGEQRGLADEVLLDEVDRPLAGERYQFHAVLDEPRAEQGVAQGGGDGAADTWRAMAPASEGRHEARPDDERLPGNVSAHAGTSGRRGWRFDDVTAMMRRVRTWSIAFNTPSKTTAMDRSSSFGYASVTTGNASCTRSRPSVWRRNSPVKCAAVPTRSRVAQRSTLRPRPLDHPGRSPARRRRRSSRWRRCRRCRASRSPGTRRRRAGAGAA